MNTKLLIPLCAAVALLAGCKDRSHDATKADEPAATPDATATPAPPPADTAPADTAPADTAPSNPPPADTQPANPPPSGGG